MVQRLDIQPERKRKLASIIEKNEVYGADISHVQRALDTRFDKITQAIHLDVEENSQLIDDLIAWENATKKPEEIPLIAAHIPGSIHLAKA